MATYSEMLKRATALKREGDIDGALRQIDQVLALRDLGPFDRPPVQKKRIYYLLLAGRTNDALYTANAIIDEAPDVQSEQILGTRYSYGYEERARVMLALNRPIDAFLDSVRATWYWQDAMRIQGRVHDEHTPEKAVAGLEMALERRYKIPIQDIGAFRKAVFEGLKEILSPEPMVGSIRQIIQPDDPASDVATAATTQAGDRGLLQKIHACIRVLLDRSR